jgi:hypothetical protein
MNNNKRGTTLARPSRVKKFKNYAILNQYNNKRIIEIASYTGDNERVVATIENGIKGAIRSCNQIQSDIKLELFSLDDHGNHTFGVMVDDLCPYEDDTVKQFFITQLATISGLFFEPKALTGH